MSNPTRPRRRAWAGLTAGAVIAGLLASAAPAYAAELPTALPDAGQSASLTIHKQLGPMTDSEADGTVNSDPGHKPVPGVTFEVQRVAGIDLTTNAGWVAASAITTATDPVVAAKAAGLETDVATGVTDAAGKITFADLPFGLYVVTETVTPDHVVPSEPFLVTVPMTDPATGGDSGTDAAWMYDIHVYPKNEWVGITKSAEPQGYGADAKAEWTVLADVPADTNLTVYKIVDRLPSDLSYDAGSATVGLALGNDRATQTPVTDPALEEGTDYTVAYDDGAKTLTVTFTDAGRDKLEAAKAKDVNTMLHVVLTFTTAIPASATYVNNADLYINDADVVKASGTADTEWGSVEFLKKADRDNPDTELKEDENLAGAEFEVYTVNPDENPGATPITVDGKSVWVSDSHGRFSIDRLPYGNYWLKEVKAPTGYEVLDEAVAFTVDSPTPTGAAEGVTKVITNVWHDSSFTLPLTGGSGTWMLTAGGILVLAAAVVFVIRSRKQEPVPAAIVERGES